MAAGRRSGHRTDCHGNGGTVYMESGDMGDGDQCPQRDRLFFTAGTVGVWKGMAGGPGAGPGGKRGCPSGSAMDAGISGEFCAAVQEFLYGAAAGPGYGQGGPYLAEPPGREPPGCGGSAPGDGKYPGRGYGTDLQHQRGRGPGAGDREPSSADGRAGTACVFVRSERKKAAALCDDADQKEDLRAGKKDCPSSFGDRGVRDDAGQGQPLFCHSGPYYGAVCGRDGV